MFKGSCVALVTPFRNGGVDYDTLKKLIEWHINSGTSCLVPCGCTGEAATLDQDEHRKVIKTVVKEARGRAKVMAGTGSNSTSEAVELTEYAKKAGADGALIISPYYNKPTQEGMYRHYSRIAECVDIPICLYNVPGRTGSNIEPETVKRLSEIDNIVAIKEASGNVSQCSEIIRICGDKIDLLSGDDSLTFPLMTLGAKGVVSVIANIIPEQIDAMTRMLLSGDTEKAREVHYRWKPLMDALFIETNPAPVKEALGMMGKIKPEIRLPLVNLRDASRNKLKQVLEALDLEIF